MTLISMVFDVILSVVPVYFFDFSQPSLLPIYPSTIPYHSSLN